jgi:hypothetical protein
MNVTSFMDSPFQGLLNFDGSLTAIVMCHDDNSNRIGVHIPRYMHNVELYEIATYYNADKKVKLNKSIIANSEKIEFSNEVKIANYFWVSPMEEVRQAAHKHDDIHYIERYNSSGEYYEHKHPHTTKDIYYRHDVSERKKITPPPVHEEILIMFLDGDPKKGYWLLFTPSLDGK